MCLVLDEQASDEVTKQRNEAEQQKIDKNLSILGHAIQCKKVSFTIWVFWFLIKFIVTLSNILSKKSIKYMFSAG